MLQDWNWKNFNSCKYVLVRKKTKGYKVVKSVSTASSTGRQSLCGIFYNPYFKLNLNLTNSLLLIALV